MAEQFVVIASTYTDASLALADFGAINTFFSNRSDIGMYDAAVIAKDPHGTVRVVTKREESTAAREGIGIVGGMAIAALIALFPPIVLGAGLLIGGASGAALGSLAGHVGGGMKRRDLRDIGKLLNNSEAGAHLIHLLGVLLEHALADSKVFLCGGGL